MTPCTCGNTKLHVTARRETADGARVLLWSDGELTYSLNVCIPGLGKPKTLEAQKRRRTAIGLILDDVSLFDLRELAGAIKRCERGLARALPFSECRKRARSVPS